MTILGSTLRIGSQHALRSYLDELNKRGEDDRCVGLDAIGQPFLVALTGPYAGGERVITCDPDDVERDQGEYCDHCSQAVARHDLTALHYPVTILARVEGEVRNDRRAP